MAPKSSSAAVTITHYTSRASTYDNEWHTSLAHDFVTHLQPHPGSICLDLACGTGLVTIPLAQTIGPTGKVIGIDITSAMLEVARRKQIPPNSASVEWIEHDITSLSSLPAVTTIITQHGGFDIIACCSALVLLPDPASALKSWSQLLKPNGKLIVDTPTEAKTLLHLFTQELRFASGLECDFDWRWITGQRSLEDLLRNAGLSDVQTWSRKSTDEKAYDADQVDEVFDVELAKYKDFVTADSGKIEEMRVVFRKEWDESVKRSADGRFHDKAMLYITMGRKLS